MSNIYYNDYYSTPILSNQKAVNEKLIDMGSLHLIGQEDLNPMTIRLFVLKESLDEIIDFSKKTKELKDICSHTAESNFRDSKSCFIREVEPVSGSASYSAAIKVIDFLPDNLKSQYTTYVADKSYTFSKKNDTTFVINNEAIHLFNLHKNIYIYFTNYMSSLDRIAFEIKKLYSIEKIETYGDLTYKSDAIETLIENNNLQITTKTLSTKSKSVFDTSKYRNRLSHDGILKLKFNQEDGIVYLQHNPMQDSSNFNINLKKYCNDKFNSLIKLINNIYEQILDDIKKNRILQNIHS